MALVRSTLLLSAVFPLFVYTTSVIASERLESGSQVQPVPTLSAGQSFRLISWNIHKGDGHGFAADLLQLAEQADIVSLQEGLLTTEQRNLLDSMQDFNWWLATAWKSSGSSTGTALLSRYQTTQVDAIISEKTQPVANTPKSSILGVLPIAGLQTELLVVNTHALNFTSTGAFEKQLKAIAERIKSHSGPILWAGDFNTWNGSRMQELQKIAGALNLIEVKWPKDSRNLKLDHVFIRDLVIVDSKIRDDITSSDHFPLSLELTLPSAKTFN